MFQPVSCSDENFLKKIQDFNPMPNFIIKRIIHYPKKALMEIGPPATIKSKFGYQTMDDLDMAVTEKNKAKELILPSGSKITKEMLDKMDLSTSSSDESSSESSLEAELITKHAIENLDMVVLQEAQKLEKKNGAVGSSGETDSSDDNEMDLEDALMRQFNLECETERSDKIKVPNKIEGTEEELEDETVIVADAQEMQLKIKEIEISQSVEEVQSEIVEKSVHEQKIASEKVQLHDDYKPVVKSDESQAPFLSDTVSIAGEINEPFQETEKSSTMQDESSTTKMMIEEEFVVQLGENVISQSIRGSSDEGSETLEIKYIKDVPLEQASDQKVVDVGSETIASQKTEQSELSTTSHENKTEGIQRIPSRTAISANFDISERISTGKNVLIDSNQQETPLNVQTIPHPDKTPLENDLAISLGEMKISKHSEKEQTGQKPSEKIPIGGSVSRKEEPQIYQFASQSIDSLSAKLFLERIRAEFHCCFVSRQDEAVVLNDLFKKSYSRKLLDVIDDELRQPELNPVFANSLRELKQSVNQKATARTEYPVSYTVDQILSIKERTEIPLNVDKKIFSSHLRRDKKEDVVSLFRFELNRIAWTNANFIIERIKRLKILKDTEMKQLSRIIFEKAISEDAFCKLYAHVVYNLYKIFKSEEEKKKHESQTVFFSEIIRLIQETFKKKEKWASQLDLSSFTIQERISMQDTIDSENIIKESKKGRMLGTVKFVSYLYSNSVIGFKGISFCLNSLMDFNDEENVETLSLLLTNCGEKIVESDKSVELTKIVNELKKPWNWSLRIKFMTQDVVQKCEDWLKAKKKKSPFKNAFSALQQNLNKTIKDDKLSKEPTFGQNLEASTEMKTKTQFTEAEQPTPDTGTDNEIHTTIDKISRIVEDIPQVVDFTSLVDEINLKVQGLDADLVYKAFFLIILEHYHTFSDDLKFLKFFLEAHTRKPINIADILNDIQKRLPDIAVDCPFAQKNFSLLVFCLNRWIKCNYDFRGFDRKTTQEKYEDLRLDE